MQFQQAQVFLSNRAPITCGWSRQSVNMHQLFNQPDASREGTRAKRVLEGKRDHHNQDNSALKKTALNLAAVTQQDGA